MPFGRKSKHKDVSVRACEFGCLPPTDGEQSAIDQMRGRVTLWNALAEIERAYRKRREVIIAPHVTVPGDATGPEDKEERRRQRRAAFKREDVRLQLEPLQRSELEEARAVWLASGLYWGNLEEVLVAWQNAAARRFNPIGIGHPQADRRTLSVEAYPGGGDTFLQCADAERQRRDRD